MCARTRRSSGRGGGRSPGARWEHWDGFYHRSEAGGGRWEFRRPLPEHWEIRYDALGLTFKIRPTSFKHTGLFPEQAVNWDWIDSTIRAAGREVSVLNLFGYTGAASCAAAAAGASVCHVDAAEGMVKWCRENAALCGLADAPIRYIADDCLKFVRREVKRGRRYDAVIMDPPTFGRGSTGELWRLEDNLWELLAECRALLTDDPLFLPHQRLHRPAFADRRRQPARPAAPGPARQRSPPARSACRSSATARCSRAGSTAAGRPPAAPRT